MAFILGWMSLFLTSAGISWLANPLLIISWFTNKKKPKQSWYASIGALIFAASFMLFDKIIDNEAGHMHKITSYGTGYQLWLLSISVMLGWNYLQLKVLKSTDLAQKDKTTEIVSNESESEQAHE